MWTSEQQKAIETMDKNILVSAAAGSGKTTVLVERIKNLVINKGVNIDRFLITTFTKAAAAEMRERLEKAIRQEMKKPNSNRQMLSKQLQKLPMSNISTFHSFAIEIIRQYSYLIELEPNFAIADETQMVIMKNQVMEEVFTRRYEEDYDRFTSFLRKYNPGRGDKKLRENILDTYRTLVSIPNYFDWAREKAFALKADDPLEAAGLYEHIIKTTVEDLETAAELFDAGAEAINSGDCVNLYAKAKADGDTIHDIIDSIRTAVNRDAVKREELVCSIEQRISNLKFNQMRKKKDDKVDLQSEEKLKSRRDAGKKLIDGLKKSYFKRSLQVAREDLLDISGDTYYYIDLVEEFVNTFRAEKEREALIDFDDVMHYAIAVLDHEEAAAELREKFEYIFVDEYQDSNELQEIIVQRIARHNNLFMVGDVKQCIYKFRLAEPEIFRNKAQLYNSEDEADSILLKLNSNFRSKIHVTGLVNDVFRKQMGDNYVGEELNGKAPEDKPGFSPRIHLINLEALDDSMVEKSQVEAEQVARIIRERLGEKIYDTKAEEWRRLELRDFAVLARGNSMVEAVEQYLNNEGIDAYGEGGGKYFETVEIQVFMNMLRVTENMRQDIPLISVMKSAVFGFTVKELAKIRIAHPEGSFYSAVMSYAGISRGQDASCDELVDKIGNMVKTLSLWKKISKTVPLEETIKKLLYDTGYYAYCSGLPVGKQRVSNLRLIADKAASFEKRSHGGLYGFLQYIEAMKDSDIDDSEARIVSENENVVRVMTVHKSKGLEFPVVIFVGASKNIVGKTGEKPITIHRDFGIALRKSNPEEHWHRKTLLQHAIERTKKQENFEEEKRILYVAMTRAKDGIDIVGTIKDDTSIILVGRPKTFLDMVYSAFDDSMDREIIRVGSTACDEDREDEGASESIERTTRDLYQEAEDRAKAGIPDEITQEVERRLSYTYPKEADVKPKYSVSELNAKTKEKSTIYHEDEMDRTSADKDIRLKTLQLGVKETKLTGAEIGTAMHLIMERLDFDRAVLPDGREYIFSTAERLRNSGILSEGAFEAISLDRIAMFFETDMGKRAAGAFADNRLWREQEFILRSKEEGVDTIIQGVIDCFFEENGKLILVDYKNSYIERGRTLDDVANEYREQIDLYTQALEGATGMKVAERYLYLFSIGKAIRV